MQSIRDHKIRATDILDYSVFKEQGSIHEIVHFVNDCYNNLTIRPHPRPLLAGEGKKIMSQLTKQDIENIARLARLKLTEQEKEKYTKELSAILEYVDALKKVDTKNVPPTAQVTGLMNIVAEDVAKPYDVEVRGELLNAAPAKAGDYIKVPPVFE